MRIAFMTSLLFGTLLVGCNKPPKACIDISTESAAVGEDVIFTSCSEKALSYHWTMTGPAGAPENEKGWSEVQFTNEFIIPGTYTVTLTAFKEFSWLGTSASTQKVITIN